MYLKRMELFGFKSFAEKTELEFSPGIAAVIGPNGCGKSNIVDAVRWALGEQSVKSLRGSRMEEIIFSGSESRKALNFAEVSLTFSGSADYLNLDYDEVTITRRLFRSGDSEYYINKSPCRLKDITELFLDTGLGKDAYSVIGQGRVEEIINSRPEERREIFEEAAGIFKYKLRKKEARRRLDETGDNLVRVQDLIFELETQIEPLQEQAEVTRRYRSLRSLVEAGEKELLSFQLAGSAEKLKKVEKSLQNVNDSLLEAASKGSFHEKEYQDLKKEQHDQQAVLAACDQKLQALTRSVEQQESELRILGEREERYRDQIDKGEQRLLHLDQLSAQLTGQKEQTEKDRAAKETLAEEEEQTLTALREQLAELEKSAIATEVGEQQEKLFRISARREADSGALADLRERQRGLAERLEELRQGETTLNEELKTCEQRTAAIGQDLEQAMEKLDRAGIVEKDAALKRDLAAEKQGQAIAGEQRVREKLHGLQSRLKLLQEQQSALTGYYRGVREVMQARLKLPGLIGPVADLIRVPADYVQAVETALGGALQHLVTETEQAAHAAISHLKGINGGWATFLPLDVLHAGADPQSRYPGWDKIEGVIGRASDLVETDPQYRPIISYTLSPVVVCADLKSASKAARHLKHSCRVVTLDGEIINPGGSIRGGSIPKRNAGMPLGRRREIEALEEESRVLEKDLRQAADAMQKAAEELKQAARNLEEANAGKLQAEEKLKELQKRLESADRDREITADRLSTRRDELRRTREEQDALKSREDELKERVEQAAAEITGLESGLAGRREDYQKHLDARKDLETKVTETLVRKNSYLEQAQNCAVRISDIKNSINGPAEEKARLLEEMENYRRELQAIEDGRSAAKTAKEALLSEQAALVAEYDRLKRENSRIEAALIELEEEGRRAQGQVSRQERRERQLSMEKATLETEINYMELRFKELFRTLDPVPVEDGYDPELARQNLQNLKDDMESLGEVNLGAIEELERLEERINFLKNQQDDLRKGEAELRKVLAEIDQRMEFYFKSAFEKISANFSDTFSELFEGGQVILKLSDPENILESGIDIVAQPPGKNLQNITLLSSGEKVLTAIALVFAILRFKPAPFYLLDEVESTLDDANLYRFTGFLKQAARENQFILITHRKRTMEESEILYGVTMPEPGVSNLMSLKLEQSKLAGGM